MDIVKNLRNGKAAGVDGMKAEIMKYILNNPEIRKHALKCFNKVLKGWFSKNTSCVYMKEFFELIQMIYATYSNSSPIARNLKIKN